MLVVELGDLSCAKRVKKAEVGKYRKSQEDQVHLPLGRNHPLDEYQRSCLVGCVAVVIFRLQ